MISESIYKNINRKKNIINDVVIIDDIPLFSWVEVNVNDLCNRSCVFCPRGNGYLNTNNHISKQLVKKISNELKHLEFTGIINISGSGEALLTKHIVDNVEIFGKNNLNIEITTNGDRLTVEKIKDLYAAGLKYLIVSMYDGPDQIAFFNDLFKQANIHRDLYILRDRWYSKEEDYGLMLTNRAGFIKSKIKNTNRKCFYPHHALYVDWNGDILLCCHDMYNKSIVFGNANDSTLFELWKNKKLIEYRKKLKLGDRSLSPCITCDVDGCIVGEEHAKLW